MEHRYDTSRNGRSDQTAETSGIRSRAKSSTKMDDPDERDLVTRTRSRSDQLNSETRRSPVDRRPHRTAKQTALRSRRTDLRQKLLLHVRSTLRKRCSFIHYSAAEHERLGRTACTEKSRVSLSCPPRILDTHIDDDSRCPLAIRVQRKEQKTGETARSSCAISNEPSRGQSRCIPSSLATSLSLSLLAAVSAYSRWSTREASSLDHHTRTSLMDPSQHSQH